MDVRDRQGGVLDRARTVLRSHSLGGNIGVEYDEFGFEQVEMSRGNWKYESGVWLGA